MTGNMTLRAGALGVAMTMAGLLAGAATLSVSDVELRAGGEGTATVSIVADGTGMFEYKGFQFDMGRLPAGVTVTGQQTGSALAEFGIWSEQLADGSHRFVVMTMNDGSVTATEAVITLSFGAEAGAEAGTYGVTVGNVDFSTPLGQDVRGDGGSFNITILPEEGPGVQEPSVPSQPIPDGMEGNGNGTYVSTLKIREGNMLGMGVNAPEGGYPEGWSYQWTAPGGEEIGEGLSITTEALLYGEAAESGERQAVSRNVYTVELTDTDPEGEIFWQSGLETARVSVYKRPRLPQRLLRKGEGNPEEGRSCTFVVMMTPLDNEQILELGYSYTYGYTDPAGEMHEIETTELRYCHTPYEIYNDPQLRFWTYSRWSYPDGSLVTSGLRYLDGAEDADFDASEFDGTRASGVRILPATRYGGETRVTGVYSLDGLRVADGIEEITGRGIYIVRYSDGKAVKIRRI